jgi:hypothetical protein
MGAVRAMQRLETAYPAPGAVKTKTPAGEAAGAVFESVWSILRTHPPAAERRKRLEAAVRR